MFIYKIKWVYIMKKNIYGFILFILLLFPINVYAMTGGLKITCSPSSVKANEVVTCTITGTSDEAVSKIEAQVVYINENVSVTSLTKDDVWSTGSIGNNNVFNVSTENSTIKDNFTVGTLKLKIGINATEPIDVNVLIQNISFTDNNGNKVSEGLTGDSATFSIDGVNEPQGPTTDPTPTVKGLKSLNITNGELVSGFDKTKDSFVANLSNADVTSFAIEAIPENANDGIVCRNSHTAEVLDCSNIFYIQSGNNNDMLIEIVVGSGDTQETYKLSILKPVSKVPELASLTIGGKSVNLVSGKTKDYEVVFELNKAEPCTLAWMKGSVYGKTYFIYQFFSLKNAPKKLLPVAKGILGLIYGSGDINSWFSDNKDININILKCITLDENLKETPDCVWALIGDIPCDKFFELLVQIAKCLELKQSNVNVDEFLHLISANPSFYSEEKNALKALFTCCVSQNDPKYNKIKEELIKKGVLPPENQ